VIKISKRLEKALNNYKSATFYNYLGYLLIDYDIDVKKGMKWVEKSLLINPQSPFYLDSLAWAYYKLQRYEEAYNTMKKVVDSLGLEDSDVKKHWKLISDKYTPKKNKLDK
jgi:tetratricopeptide (TPR) repeat protein